MRPVPAALALAGSVVVACANAAGPAVSASPPRGVLSVPEVNARREAYVGKKVAVLGKVAVEEQRSLGPCNVVTGAGCNQVFRVTLRLVNPDDPQGKGNQLDLYRSAAGGTFRPAECTIRRPAVYDCARYTPGSIMIVGGTFVKYREPVQQVIYPDGRVVVLQSRDRYVLVVS